MEVDKEKEKGDKKSDKKEEGIKLPDPVKIQFEGIKDRNQRMTLHSSQMDDALITADGEKVLYLGRIQQGF